MVWHTVPRSVQLLFPKRVWSEDPSGKQVYLTFDDGPVPGVTDYVLNELAKRGQKATFFMVGDNIRKFPELASEVASGGHSVGNHTFNHFNGWKTSDSNYLKNVREFDRITSEKLQIQTDLFRPPYGLIKGSQAKVLLQSKKIVMWNVLSGDYDSSLDPSRILAQSIKNTCPGSIVLFHDQQKTKEVLPRVLPEFLDFLLERKFQTSVL